jgi:CO dehydrogenase maturation factor
LVLRAQEAVIMDMEAGIEHLGRATARSMDLLLVVIDEGPWSVQTALRVRTLAQDIGLSRVAAVVNRVRPTTDLDAIRDSLQGIPLAGTLPYDERLAAPLIQESLDEHLKPADVMIELLPAVQSILESSP